MLSPLVLRPSSRTYLACLCYGAVGLTNTVFGATLTPVAGEYGLSLPTAGLLIALQYGGFVIAGPIAGELADRFGQRLVIPAGYALMALGLAAFGLLGWWPAALGAALLLGLGFGVCGTTVNAYVADLNPGRRGWAIALVQFAFGCGSVLSPFVAAGLLAGGRSWRLLFALDAILALGALALFVLLLHPSATNDEHSRDGAPPAPLAQRSPGGFRPRPAPATSDLALLSLAMASYMGVQAGLTAWIAPYAQHALGAGSALATLGGTTLWAGLTSGRLASSFVGERAGYARTALASSALGLVMLLGFLALRDGTIAVAGATVVGLAYGPCFPMILAAGARLLPGRSGASTGVILASGSAGAAVLPWLAGQAASSGSQATTLTFLLGVGAGLLALVGWFCRRIPGAD
jgi:MFS transporter, FHS family, glucose/mannose:H+ symporter